MIVIPSLALRKLMNDIVNVTHGLVDTAGNPVTTNTIADAQLRMAALNAIQTAIGDTVWPGDRKITITRRKQTDEIFEEV